MTDEFPNTPLPMLRNGAKRGSTINRWLPERLRTIPPLLCGKKSKKPYREYYGNTFGPASRCRRPNEDQIAAIAARYDCVQADQPILSLKEAASAEFVASMTESSPTHKPSRKQRVRKCQHRGSAGIKRVKSAYFKLYDEARHQIAFTGTLKQKKLHSITGSLQPKEFLDIELAGKNLELFMTGASRKLLGKRAVRGGQQLSCTVVVEGNPRSSVTGEPRMHIHGSIGGLPDGAFDLNSPTDLCRLERLLAKIWRGTPWGYNEFRIELLSKATWELDDKEFTANGWRDYIFKDIHAGNTERVIIRNQFLN